MAVLTVGQRAMQTAGPMVQLPVAMRAVWKERRMERKTVGNWANEMVALWVELKESSTAPMKVASKANEKVGC